MGRYNNKKLFDKCFGIVSGGIHRGIRVRKLVKNRVEREEEILGEPEGNKTSWFLFDLFIKQTQFPTHVWLRVYSTYFTGKLDQVRVTQIFIICIMIHITKNKSTTKPKQPCSQSKSNLRKNLVMKQKFKKNGRFGILGPPTTKLEKTWFPIKSMIDQ